jgi:hypothetical protein
MIIAAIGGNICLGGGRPLSHAADIGRQAHDLEETTRARRATNSAGFLR